MISSRLSQAYSLKGVADVTSFFRQIMNSHEHKYGKICLMCFITQRFDDIYRGFDDAYKKQRK